MPPELLRIPLAGDVPAEHAVFLVAGDERPFALCGKWAGSRAIVGSEPRCVTWASYSAQNVTHLEGDGVGGGWFGVLGFQLGRNFERTGDPPPRPIPQEAVRLAYYDHVLRLDRDGRWWFEALWTPEREAALEERRRVLAERLARGVEGPRTVETTPWRSTPGPEGHAAAVQACRDRIAAGDLFQANLTVRLEARLDRGSAADVFALGVEVLRPDRAAFFAYDGAAVASLSPELFLQRKGRTVKTAPIKGTARDREALETSAKDRAENVMIVDLVRNDLGRVCEPGTVAVEALAEPRPHTGVWHLVSEVAGTLREDATDADLLRATFPPGSVTGAPKVAALDVIAELESTGREAYTGAIGFASPIAGLELNVAIRTFEVSGDRIWLGAGGGVVADSDPAAEAREAATKAAPLLNAIGARLEPPRRRPHRAPAPLRLAPRPIPRPDPAAGVFETIRARDGEPARLDDHLDRLARSVEELYGAERSWLDEAARLVEEAARRVGDGRVRLDATPEGGGIALRVRSGPIAEEGALELRPVCVPGGLGPHKWADRRLLDALGEMVGPAIPLLVDLDGLVLEAARANVAIVEDGDLITPPADGRILPGIGRESLGAREEVFGVERLERADAVLLVNALRGVQVVRGDQDLIASTISSGASSWM
ncbi:MAG TPA: chorismate-binding protein [Solirubrobacteraceae bacterium]|jgi:para-aminobenzoate synthetase/4-amino-4-deoxychorismate lyase